MSSVLHTCVSTLLKVSFFKLHKWVSNCYSISMVSESPEAYEHGTGDWLNTFDELNRLSTVARRRALVLHNVAEGTWSIFQKCVEDISVPRSFEVLTRRSKVAFQFPKYVVLLSINTIVQCLLKYEIPWLFHNLWRYRKINQIELLFATATFYTYTAEVKSTHFASIFFSHIYQVHAHKFIWTIF